MNRARRHHVVPRFYLNGFAADEAIGTVELPGNRRFVQSTRNAAISTDFYTVPDETGAPSDEFEQALSQVEGPTSEIVRRIEAGRWPLEKDDRDLMAVFLALQFLRGPDLRNQLEQMQRAIAQAQFTVGGRESVAAHAAEVFGRDPTEAEVDDLWAQVTAPGGPPIPMTSAAHIEQLGHALPEILPYFVLRPWYLVRFTRRSLLACDTPVVLQNDPRTFTLDEGVGLATAMVIALPLSRRLGLLFMNPPGPGLQDEHQEEVREMVWSGSLDGEERPTVRLAEMFNRLTITNARRWIFHHPEDAALVPEDLPDPRTREIATSGTNFAETGPRLDDDEGGSVEGEGAD